MTITMPRPTTAPLREITERDLIAAVKSRQGRELVTVAAVARELDVPPSDHLRRDLDRAAAVGLLERMQLYTRRHAGEPFRLERVTYQAITNPVLAVCADDELGPPSLTWPAV